MLDHGRPYFFRTTITRPMMDITSDSNSKSVISVTSFSIRRQIRRHPPLSPGEARRPATYHQWQCHGHYTGILRRCGGIRICASQPSHPISGRASETKHPQVQLGKGRLEEGNLRRASAFPSLSAHAHCSMYASIQDGRRRGAKRYRKYYQMEALAKTSSLVLCL